MPVKFSVLIPVYNVERYLKECVDSVLNQSYPAYEIILIDDGSTDGSGRICEEYTQRDGRIKVYHQENQGLLMARRSAVKKAKGDYYIFLDSDDYWDNDLLQTVNKTIEETGCDIVIFKFRKLFKNRSLEQAAVFEDGSVFDSQNKEKLFKKIIGSSALNNFVCKAVRRSIPDNTDYITYCTIKHCEDLIQSLPLLYGAEKIIYIDKAMYNYRVNSQSITNSRNIHMFDDFTAARGLVLEYARKMNICSAENLDLFYGYYRRRVLKYIEMITTADVPKGERYGVYEKIKQTPLYIDSLKFNGFSFTLNEKIISLLFEKDAIYFLTFYIKAANILRKARALIKKEREL